MLGMEIEESGGHKQKTPGVATWQKGIASSHSYSAPAGCAGLPPLLVGKPWIEHGTFRSSV